MDDDEVFDRSMALLGVDPLDGAEPGRLAAERDRIREDNDRRLFEQAIRALDAGGSGGMKAGRAATGRAVTSQAAPKRARLKAQRLKTRPKNLRVDDQIDLHGLRSEAALKRLEHFVAQATGAGVRNVLVITGKGHHSPGGRGILRQQVEEWIRGRSGRWVRTWFDAPPRLGGRGAFVLYLRATAS